MVVNIISSRGMWMCGLGLGENAWNKVTNNLFNFSLKSTNNSLNTVCNTGEIYYTHPLLASLTKLNRGILSSESQIQLKFTSSDSKTIQYALVKIPDKTLSKITAMAINDNNNKTLNWLKYFVCNYGTRPR